MKIATSKILKIALLFIVVIMTVLVGGRYLLFHLIEKKIKDAALDLEKEGIIVTYDSLYSNPWKGSVSLKGLEITAPNDKKDPTTVMTLARVASIQISGMKILPLIFHRRIVVDSLWLDQPSVQVPEGFHFSGSGENKTPLRGFSIRQINITTASFEILDSVSLQTSRHVRFNTLNVTDIAIDGLRDHAARWGVGTSNLDVAVVSLVNDMYTVTVKHAGYNAVDKNITIDSIRIIPDYDKQVFAKKAIRQIDRVDATIPFIKARGCQVNRTAVSSFSFSQVALAFTIDVFRDKRYPFHNKLKNLPERFLHSLPINLQVDTLMVKDSHVSYEEFPEKGDRAGRVFFDHLQASLYNLSNISPEGAKMEADADLMGAGKLRVNFTFPADPDKAYFVSGTLTNFDLQKINPMLEPLANARVQSGKMEEMKFHFEYNDYRSDGEVVLNYTDLKMESRKKNNLGDKIVTLLLNTFIRNTMDRHTDTAKKTGTILFYRDQHRAIFNYWWKSLLSGIKSVYNLDKITNTSSNKKSK